MPWQKLLPPPYGTFQGDRTNPTNEQLLAPQVEPALAEQRRHLAPMVRHFLATAGAAGGTLVEAVQRECREERARRSLSRHYRHLSDCH